LLQLREFLSRARSASLVGSLIAAKARGHALLRIKLDFAAAKAGTSLT
jgi:hypothetical protein